MSQINSISLTGSLTIGGSRPIIMQKTLTANGTYSAGTDDADGYSPVIVNVPESVPVVTSLNVTENGTYQVEQGVDGFNPVVVNVPDEPTIPLNADNIQIATSSGYYMSQQPLTNNITESGYYLVSLIRPRDNSIWNTFINYDGVSDVELSINYSDVFKLHLTPTTIGTQYYGGDFETLFVKLSKTFIASNQTY